MNKYQIRIKDIMGDRPATGLMACNIYEAYKRLEEVREEIKNTWATPDPDAAYLVQYDSNNRSKIINC